MKTKSKTILPAMKDRPTCSTKGCNNKCQVVGRDKNNHATFRRVCGRCHIKICAINKGLTESGWLNSFHPYRKWRKDYCENIDGRLGFKCTTTIMTTRSLHTDHIDGNPSNNTKENMQTFCSCCHDYKTMISGDLKTPGRKTLGLSY